MDRKDFESLLNYYPDCVSDGKKLKAFLKDLYPDVPKAIVNTLTIMADDGIISEMQKAGQAPLVSARLQKKLEDDYGLSQKIISECFLLIIYDSAKQPQTTNNARSHEKINVSAHTTSKSASKKENFPQNTTKSEKKPLPQSIPAKNKTIKQANTNFAGDPKDFEIENGTLKKYKGSSSVVVIPDSVTSIGNGAFYNCSGLTSVTIPDSVTSIGDSAFSGCTGLTNITIPNSVTDIGEWTFYGCTGLTSVRIPDSETCIGYQVFYGCSGLTSVTIGNSVTSICFDAFSDCYRLVEVYNKSALSITAGSSSNGEVAYYAKNVYTNEGGSKLTTDENGYVIYTDQDEKILVAYHGTNTELALPSYITKINQYAFYNCKGLTSVTVGGSVTSIGDCAFFGCKRLASVTIPDSVESIGSCAFDECRNLKIYCEAESEPIGWFGDWNPEDRPVVWGFKN